MLVFRFVFSFFFLFSLLFSPFAAFAAGGGGEKPVILLNENPQAELLCTQTVKHNPKDVQYTEGVDVHGNPIVTADIKKDPLEMYYYPLEIPLELNVIEKFHLDVPIGIIANPEVAGIRIFRDGRVEYNGQNVTDDVLVFCREEVEKKKAFEEAEAAAKGGKGGGHGEEISGEHH